MNLRTWARVLIAVSFSISGLVETLSATGLVVELSPDGRWGPGVHTLAVSGPLQMVGAALLAFGHKTRWVVSILGCYVFLTSVLGNLPLVFDPHVGGSAIAGLLINLAVMGGVLYWLRTERLPNAQCVKTALPMAHSATAWPARLLVCQDPSGLPSTATSEVPGHAAVLTCR
jgi:uncharacterized membrane protein YphA (DoxX/SURF4 family)